MTSETFRIAVDIGGTFVDAMELSNETSRVRFEKAPTTPQKPWEGVLDAIGRLGTDLSRTDVFIHGTTLGLNAVLERRGEDTGIITNDGFRDIFLLGRGNVPDAHMYDFQYQRPPSLVRRRHTTGVRCRIDHTGAIVEELDESSLRDAARYLVEEEGVRSVAVCYLHSYINPVHEQRTAELLRSWYPELTVSVSTDIVREYREYERTSTAVLEAYIRPIFERYVDELEKGLAAQGFTGRFLIMRSGGGSMTSTVAKTSPTHTVLSGPAGGIIGAAYVASELGRDRVLTVDIGGTSLDACVIENGSAVTAHQTELEHYPVLIPSFDIRTIGAGGGSIAWIDRQLLKVGPQSAGALPGPVCYGRGGSEPTVTDAAVILGYVNPGSFMAGKMPLLADEAEAAMVSKVASPLGMTSHGAAVGMFDVMLAKTVGAVRQITVERGHDPRVFSLLAFGGAGPLIAPLLAREMGIAEVIVPFAPSGFSAWGMLSADLVHDASRTVMQSLEDLNLQDLDGYLAGLESEARKSLELQGVVASDMHFERRLDVRYLGQEHTLGIPVAGNLEREGIVADFNAAHMARYGHAMDNQVQILTARVRGIGVSPRPDLPVLPPGDGDPTQAKVTSREAFDFGARTMTAFEVYDRALLEPGDSFDGPALVDEGTSTSVVHSGQRVVVDDHGYLLITSTSGEGE